MNLRRVDDQVAGIADVAGWGGPDGLAAIAERCRAVRGMIQGAIVDYQILQARLAEIRIQVAQLPDHPENARAKAKLLVQVGKALDDLNGVESSSRRVRTVPPPADIPGPDDGPDDVLVVVVRPGRDPSVLRA